MKAKRFVPTLVLGLIGLFCVSALSTAGLASPGDTEQVQLAQESPPPPKTISPKNPGEEAPLPSRTCPHCGRQIESRWDKGAKARPRLGEARVHREFMRRERHGMQGRHERHEHRMGHRSRSGHLGHRTAGRHGHFDMLLDHADILGLTEAQQAKLKELRLSAEKEMIDLKAAMQKEQLQLRQLMQAEDLDARSIKRQMEAVAQARTNLKFRQISLRIEARDVLTAEQKDLIKEKLKDFTGGYGMGHYSRDCAGMFCPPGCCANSGISPDPDVAPEREMHLEEE